jgi:phosphatidylglycerol---prolipoprotein diacylglyceryl transferase
MIPYVEVPELPLSFLTHLPLLDRVLDPRHPPSIKPFGTLVAFGVYLGSVVAMRHARERAVDEKKMSEVIFYVVGVGFLGGHMLDAIFYHPAHLAQDPLYLFKIWDGLSSYGGFIGAVLGALIWRCVSATWKPITVPWRGEAVTLFSIPTSVRVTWRHGRRVLPYIECVNSAFPLAWVFGRMGCASVHDHPGLVTDAWYAVRWPLPGGGVTGRLDLGLIEMVLTIPLAVAFLVLWRRKPVRPLGFYSGWMCIAYAPVRFFLDFLREGEGTGGLAGGDPRYGGLTPAQWACFGLFALGVYMLRKSRQPSDASPTGDADRLAATSTGDANRRGSATAGDADRLASASAGEGSVEDGDDPPQPAETSDPSSEPRRSP